MTYPTYNIGDKVKAWVRSGPLALRENPNTHEEAWVNHFGTEVVHGIPMRVYFLKDVNGKMLPGYFFSPGLTLLEKATPFSLPPSNQGPMWVSYYGPKSSIAVWFKNNRNKTVKVAYHIWEEVAGGTTSFIGENLKGLAWETWVKENESQPVPGCKHGKYKSIIGHATS